MPCRNAIPKDILSNNTTTDDTRLVAICDQSWSGFIIQLHIETAITLADLFLCYINIIMTNMLVDLRLAYASRKDLTMPAIALYRHCTYYPDK
jgi:hypothetical protein